MSPEGRSVTTLTLTWHEARAKAQQAFRGQLPDAVTEQAILDAFQRSPLTVLAGVDLVGERFAQGKVSAPWRYLAKHLERLEAVGDVTVEVDERQTRVAAAEKWIRNAGYHVTSESELADALFGDHGLLRDYAADDVLRARMVDLWERERPRGVLLERVQAEQLADLERKRAELAALVCVCAFVRRMSAKQTTEALQKGQKP
jgi:hypothetical protein